MISSATLSTSGHIGAPVYDWQFYTKRKTMKQMLERVAQDSRLTVGELLSPSRVTFISDARQRFMYEAARDGRWSWAQIARACGRKDHNTAWTGARAYAKRHGLPEPEARA